MTTGIPLLPGTTLLVPQDLYHTTEALKRGYAPALCFPPPCWGARGSDPQPVAASLGRHRSEGSGDFWGVILQHFLVIEVVPAVQASCPGTTAGLVSAQPSDLHCLSLLGWKKVFYYETTNEGVSSFPQQRLTETDNSVSPLHTFISAW